MFFRFLFSSQNYSQESQDVGSSSSLTKYPSHNAIDGFPVTARMRDMHIFERIGNMMFIIGSTPNRIIGEHFEELAHAHGETFYSQKIIKSYVD